jgi:hypothetical protein
MTKWKIEKKEYVGGDLFDIVGKVTYAVYFENIEQPVYYFEEFYGDQEPELIISEISIDAEASKLRIQYRDESTKIYPLIDPFQPHELSQKALLFLTPFFENYQKLQAEYEYVDYWSNDVSIPVEAIKAAEAAAQKAKQKLQNAFNNIGLAQHQSTLSFDIKEMIDAKIGAEKLLKKLDVYLKQHYPKNYI